ncbi:MAG TPA: hypothetical protein VES00_20735 [Burkholderiaceae bacterium]|jgi:hypothetical protein|nr:hypothetical protein [Burkholderiaceae bacterium]
MSTPSRAPNVATAITLLALAAGPLSARADAPAPNDGMRYVSAGAQADGHGNQQVLSTLSLPVGRRAWVQAGAGASRSDPAAGGRRPAILTGGAGIAGKSLQLAVSTSQRFDGSRYRQSDWGSSLDWRQDGNDVGLDVTHRRSRASGTVAMAGGQGGATAVPAQARVAGTGVGMHGALQVSEHVSVYGAVARNHYRSSTQATASTGGLLGANPLLAQALLGASSVVNRDEAALDRSAQVGATYRWSKVALSGEYTTGQVHDDAGALHSAELKAAIDVAPGWRVTPGVGRGTSDQGGHATFASLSATYGW